MEPDELSRIRELAITGRADEARSRLSALLESGAGAPRDHAAAASLAEELGLIPVREPLSFKVARDHLVGALTAGVYVVRLDNTVCFCAFDVDMAKKAIEDVRGDPAKARSLRQAVVSATGALQTFLEGLGIRTIGEESGYKGRHLWALLGKPVDAALAFEFGRLVLASLPARDPRVNVEFLPKQARTGPGIGNLIKLPLGVHRRTGRWSRFLGHDDSPSCSKLRKRIPHVAGHACLDCEFPKGPNTYPHPLRHLETLPPAVGRPRPVAAPAGDLDEETAEMRVAVLKWMQAAGTDRLGFPEGEFVLVQGEGEAPSVEWRPALTGVGTADGSHQGSGESVCREAASEGSGYGTPELRKEEEAREGSPEPSVLRRPDRRRLTGKKQDGVAGGRREPEP
jgi:hypothetical protein